MTKNEIKAYVKSIMSKETKVLLKLVKKTMREGKAVKTKPAKLVKKTRKSKKSKMEVAA
jgi:hypothetical protein